MSAHEETLSKTITFLRFPLIVAVVFIHTNLPNVVIEGNLIGGGGNCLYMRYIGM